MLIHVGSRHGGKDSEMEFKEMYNYAQGLKEVGLEKDQRREYIKRFETRHERSMLANVLVGTLGAAIGVYLISKGLKYQGFSIGVAAALNSPRTMVNTLADPLKHKVNAFTELTNNLRKSRQTGNETDAGLEQAIKVLNKIV